MATIQVSGCNFESATIVAQKPGSKMYIARWGKIWRYVAHFAGQEPFTTGDQAKTKRELVRDLDANLNLADLTPADRVI